VRRVREVRVCKQGWRWSGKELKCEVWARGRDEVRPSVSARNSVLVSLK